MSKYFYKAHRRARAELGVYDPPRSLGICMFCAARMVRLAKSASHRSGPCTDDVCLCTACGWWEYVAREAWAATTFHGVLRHFDDDRTVQAVAGLLRALTRGTSAMGDVTSRQFEQIAYAYFRDAIDGSVELTTSSKDGGYDLYCVDAATGPFIVEAKHYGRRVTVSVVRALFGVMFDARVPTAILFVSSAVTRGARRFMARRNSEGTWRMESRDINDIMAWLRLTWGDFDPALLREQIKQLSPNGQDFTIPEEFFSRPERNGA